MAAPLGVETSDGRRLAADLVLVSIGVIPNTELAAAAGLGIDDGIVVDTRLATADPAISAIGDCANFPTRFARVGFVSNRCRTRSIRRARSPPASPAQPQPYDKVPWFWSDQRDLKLQIAGLTAGRDQTVLRGDPAGGSFSVFCFRGSRLIGVESVNRPADHVVARRLLLGAPRLSPDEAADPDFDLRALARRPP